MPDDEPSKRRKTDFLVACGCKSHYKQDPAKVRVHVRIDTAKKDFKKDEQNWNRFGRGKEGTETREQYEAWKVRKRQFERLEQKGPPYSEDGEELRVYDYNQHAADLQFALYEPAGQSTTQAAPTRQQLAESLIDNDDGSSSESDSDESAGTDVDENPEEPYEESDEEEVDDEARHPLDGINSIEDLGTIFPKLASFASRDAEHARRARRLVEDMIALFHDGSTMASLKAHYERNTEICDGDTVIESGHSMRQLWLRLQPSTVELYSCKYGHEFGEPRSRCEHALPNGKKCKHDRIIKCTHYDLREMLHFLMRDKEFASNVRWGLEKMDPPGAPVRDEVESVMQSQGVKDLEERIPFRSTGPNSLPLLAVMMVDGFQATQTSRTIDTVRLRECRDALMFGDLKHASLTLSRARCRFRSVFPVYHPTWSRITSCLSPSSTVRALPR